MSILTRVERLGVIHYRQSLQYQYKLSRDIQNGDINRILICQHPPVYTLGRRQKGLQTPQTQGAETILTNRGGLSTFHGPGQLVCYPILNLTALRNGKHIGGIRWYIKCLENAVINTCREFDVVANTNEHVGVWTGGEKICSIGVHIQRGVTIHGLALNCSTDLSWFDSIEPCGIVDCKVTSLSKVCERIVRVEDVVDILLENLRALLGVKLC
ncbi:hypothetical protein LOD99_3782 [Oopsacas minuta]|uniref:Octanoyl-[acyl-carrier-protein]:protein N-octanoyltransferase LIPT2, mitochondrial n=1 Tax=Oopsacas minuta TaxID=111878 RepID=A0AAV7JWN6_9METZ|nr:hypothetical protein LOD99_3782 [Oopsacas minuta]